MFLLSLLVTDLRGVPGIWGPYIYDKYKNRSNIEGRLSINNPPPNGFYESATDYDTELIKSSNLMKLFSGFIFFYYYYLHFKRKIKF